MRDPFFSNMEFLSVDVLLDVEELKIYISL